MLHAYEQPAFDMAIPDQGIWLLSRFHDPFLTVAGRNLFGDHPSFIYLLLVPVYWVFPHTETLLVVQSVLIALGAVPVYLLARYLLRSWALATCLAAAYLLNPALQQTNLEQFHVECFETPLLALGIYAAVVWRPRLFILCVVLVLMCKEDAALYTVPLALWALLRRDRKVAGPLSERRRSWRASTTSSSCRRSSATRVPTGGGSPSAGSGALCGQSCVRRASFGAT